VGNPNCGKTTLFNALTGLRQKVGNYPGVTVERKEGVVVLDQGRAAAHLLDLPGLYSLTPHSPDERIARDALLGALPGVPRPVAIINVVDASNLERNLYLTTQLLDLGLPMLVVLTMNDTAAHRGVRVEPELLQLELGVPVRSVIASRRDGFGPLLDAIAHLPQTPPPDARRWALPPRISQEIDELAALLQAHHALSPRFAVAEATALLGLNEGALLDTQVGRWAPEVRSHVLGDHHSLSSAGLDPATAIAEARYAEIGRIVIRAVRQSEAAPISLSERIDRIVLHRIWGYAIFLSLMVLLFQAMFSWASVPADALSAGVDTIGHWVSAHVPAGDLRELIVGGVLGGVGNTIVFLPQILLLFLFISLLEDTGYLARAAFLMDRLMSRVGLHGKSFIPLLSSYACAIPGILATRTIDSQRARLLTILVAPLMSCSARLPVYAVMIGAFIPHVPVAGAHLGSRYIGLTLPAVTLLAMYALGTVAAFGMAALFNRTLLRGTPPTFLLEMPPYRLPSVRTVLYQMLERAWLFLRRAGTVILPISVVLWALAAYPRLPAGSPSGDQLAQSYAGRLGKAIEPVIAPLGFDWKMGIGIVSSFAAREVFVTTMGTIYNVESGDDDDRRTLALETRMRAERRPDGSPVYTPLVAVALMVYYVLAMQCMSTIAVVRRETNSWGWPLFQTAYMTLLAWVVTFVVYQGGRAMGYL
jgi:ferrous iron transport protein B